MGSLIPGYEYDIFISYRQNDNKYDGWVTEFVANLNKELEATIKEKVTVYFDANPHDGLLETHSVDRSLEDKLRCLLFIPILSRTYCDPKSYAWNNEFLTFLNIAREDNIGFNVKLTSGNVASRVLPIRIHDLNPEDITLVESSIGVIRSIDFIYKSSGVNRPLRAKEDHPHDNLNNIYYRDQINKVANAIDEIIRGLKMVQPESERGKSKNDQPAVNDLIEYHKREATEHNKSKSKRWLIFAVSVLLLIVGAFAVYKVASSSKQADDVSNIEKSIAVLPFVNDSPDKENEYFCNGMMDEILNNLQRIKDFRVLSRTSTEQYRGASKPAIPKIAKALDVNYLVEGSIQKYGNTFRLRVQLIAANNEKHLWGESYEQEIKETKDIFKIQSQVAQSIASKLKATISPEEKLIIENTPTKSLTAYDFYQRGMYEFDKYPYPQVNSEANKRAETLFREALDYDSTFAQAYAGLAHLYWIKRDRNYTISESHVLNNYLDSMLLLANLALYYDDNLPQSYIIRGAYYRQIGNTKQALNEWDKALKYNQNNWFVYYMKGTLYEEFDALGSIENFQKAASLNHGPEIIQLLTRVGDNYYFSGFPEEGNNYYLEVLKLDGDSIKYSDHKVIYDAISQSNYSKAIDHFKKRYLSDSANADIMVHLGYYYSLTRQYKESLKYYQKYLSTIKATGKSSPTFNRLTRIGYSFLQNGYFREAEYYFDKEINALTTRLISVPPDQQIYYYFPLACVYASKGEKDKAYANLKAFNRIQSSSLKWVMLLKNDPLFNNIRNEPEFQNILMDVESRYQADNESVKKWLENQDR